MSIPATTAARAVTTKTARNYHRSQITTVLREAGSSRTFSYTRAIQHAGHRCDAESDGLSQEIPGRDTVRLIKRRHMQALKLHGEAVHHNRVPTLRMSSGKTGNRARLRGNR
ncbi:hypothetical protein [Reyranella sp. CPCC 100927]|uniref:hypothetical protein n=1 Tax=Reyranella sp. CPCC 100927 TaxID=2599616 RepID=UPI0011B3CC30|nr:hypothetical protein [Reyranella sp. CPCC 100927]TWT10636.1 hypothetical protein FQU96_16080 [Reyranella sp. CPCC 100927]